MSETSGAPEFAALVERYQASVLAVAYSATGRWPIAEEIAQETFLTAWRKLAAGTRVDAVGAWLCGIARKLAANARRKRREVAADPSLLEAAEAADPTVLDRMIDREAQLVVRRALASLSPRYREPLVLFYFSGQSVKEVAAALGLGEDTVKQRLSRGRQQLKDGVSGLVERTLAGAKPRSGFTVAVLAAFAVERGAEASPGAPRRGPGVGTAGRGPGWSAGAIAAAIGASVAVVVAIVVVVTIVARGASPEASLSQAPTAPAAPVIAATPPLRAVRLEVTRADRPAAARTARAVPARPAAAAAPVAAGASASRLARTMDLDFLQVDAGAVLQLVASFTEVPILVKGPLAAPLDLHLANAPAGDVLDEVLLQAGASRTEVPGLRLVAGGTLDVTTLPPGAKVSLELTDAPLADAVALIAPALGMPLVVAAEAAEATVTVHVTDVPARAALAAVLGAAHLGAEATTGFAVTADDVSDDAGAPAAP